MHLSNVLNHNFVFFFQIDYALIIPLVEYNE